RAPPHRRRGRLARARGPARHRQLPGRLALGPRGRAAGGARARQVLARGSDGGRAEHGLPGAARRAARPRLRRLDQLRVRGRRGRGDRHPARLRLSPPRAGGRVRGASMPRIRIGVVGCGLIAQMMHVPHLVELDDLYELAAVCDVSPGALAFVGDRYGIARRHTDWRALLEEPLDAVLIATAGSHAPIALAALASGKPVLTEKPMCYTLRE